MSLTPNERIKTGRAEITIKHENGIITVTHSDGTTLLDWAADRGDWEKIWDGIVESVPSTGYPLLNALYKRQ